jgi:CRP/FNR family cyclic AMP-dependent transcriptional regulator
MLPAHSCITCAVKGPQCFCTLPAADLLALQNLGTLNRFEAGETILREGFSAQRVHIICRGRVKITAASEAGRLLLVRIAAPGDVLGLASILRASQYKVSAQAIDPGEVKSIPRDAFLKFMRHSPDVGENTAVAVAREYESALLSARRLALSSSAAGKLASALLDWARVEQDYNGLPRGSSTLEFTMPLTHEELGCMAGLSRETVTRLLTRFRSEGLLTQQGDRMTLLQPGSLESLYC